MGISGSQPALMQNRAGIARAGATRAGYYTPNSVLVIAGTNRSTALLAGSLSFTQALNDEPWTASFTLVPSAGFIPLVGHSVAIGLGTALVLEFAGQVLRVTHRRRPKNELPFIDVECIDYQRLFDRRRVSQMWKDASATTIISDVIDGYTAGFTRVNVQAGLPVIDDEFKVDNMRPTQVLREVTTRLGPGAGFVIDAFRDVHAWGTAGESGPGRPSPPQTLTNSLSTLKTIDHTYDASQIRNRVTVEGRSTKTLWTVPAGAFFPDAGLPIEYGWMFDFAGDVRIGGRVFHYSQKHSFTGIVGRPAALTTAAVAVGASSMTVATNADIGTQLSPGGVGWVVDPEGGQYFLVTMPVSGTTTLELSITSGYGSVVTPIPTGGAVYLVDALFGFSNADEFLTNVTDLAEITEGETVTVHVTANDTVAQAALAAIEGGDGIHEGDIIADSTLAYDGAAGRAQAELLAFANEAGLLTVTWDTEDLNAKPGTRQVVTITGNDPLSVTLTIARVSVTVRATKTPRPPLRTCEATTTKIPRGVVDMFMTRPR